MHESIETSLSTVSTGSRLSDASKGHTVERGVEHGVVDGCSTRARVREEVFGLGFVGGEEVEAERGVADGVCDFDELLLGAGGDDVVREDRAEDFFGKEGVVEAGDFDDGGLDPVAGGVGGTAEDDGAVGVIEEGLDAVEVAGVDDVAAVGGVVGAVREEGFDGGVAALDESCFLRGVEEDVVSRDTDLAAVVDFSPEGALCGEFGVGGGGDDDGVQTAAGERSVIGNYNLHEGGNLQLQETRREMFRGSGADDFRNVGGAGVHDLVPLLLQQRAGLGNPAIDARISIAIQPGDNLLQHERGRKTQLGGLNHGRAPCRNSAHKRRQNQLERIIIRSTT